MEIDKCVRWTYVETDLYQFGDWFITRDPGGYRLLVSNGQSYGPFASLQHAIGISECIRG